jgi:hypothetical protein
MQLLLRYAFLGADTRSPTKKIEVIYVTGNNACHWYFNPPIAEAQPFYARYIPCSLLLYYSSCSLHQPAHSPLHKLSMLNSAPACNARFKDRHYPIDLSAAVPPESEEEEQPIIIEHKSLEELNQLGPYAFPVISSLPSLPCLLRITKKCFSSSADVLYLFFLYPQASGFHCIVQITSVLEDNSWWYLGCALCKKSSSEQVGGGPWCKTCETADFRPRSCLTQRWRNLTLLFICFRAITSLLHVCVSCYADTSSVSWLQIQPQRLSFLPSMSLLARS